MSQMSSSHKRSIQMSRCHVTQMDHAESGQVLPIIVMDLDINPTVSHLDKSETIIAYDFKNRLGIVALKSLRRTLTLPMISDLCQ